MDHNSGCYKPNSSYETAQLTIQSVATFIMWIGTIRLVRKYSELIVGQNLALLIIWNIRNLFCIALCIFKLNGLEVHQLAGMIFVILDWLC